MRRLKFRILRKSGEVDRLIKTVILIKESKEKKTQGTRNYGGRGPPSSTSVVSHDGVTRVERDGDRYRRHRVPPSTNDPKMNSPLTRKGLPGTRKWHTPPSVTGRGPDRSLNGLFSNDLTVGSRVYTRSSELRTHCVGPTSSPEVFCELL